ncbi:MAG: VanZ family protein [Ignavibacteriae bacterium]|nr:hypothetical protein [Ignavibacteriota bacterium]NOG96395.1 VanZ family protein [Ignavibacteriota bacterium]
MYNYLKENRRKVVYFPLIVYWIILLIATSIPTDDFPRVLMTVGDKIKHFSAYLILGGYLSLAFSLQERFPKLQEYFIIGGIVVASVYGLLDEFHQAFIPGRFFEWYDWIADILGAVAGSSIIGYILNKKVFQKK